MKTKIVYVLTSSDKDIYLEQAFVSMSSLRRYNPDACVILLTDDLTAATFTGNRKRMIELASEIVTVMLDHSLNAQERSRQLKTSVRNYIEGDFLFIDCDTIVVKPLDDIDNTSAVIAACRDTHSNFADNPYRDLSLRHGHLLGWPIDEEQDYFNSGVIYVKDVPEAHEFYRRWNENLNAGYAHKVKMDQPSFAKTNYEMGHIIQHLTDVWNCELKHGIRYMKDAYIIHYLCTNPSRYQDKQLFLLNEKEVLLEVKKTGEISQKIKDVIEDPFVGLAETTHCFAGEDLYYFRSQSYRSTRWSFKRDKITKYEIMFKVINKCKEMFIRRDKSRSC